MGELKDRVEGKVDEVKGKITADRPTELKGKGKQLRGQIRGKANAFKDGMRDAGTAHVDDAGRSRSVDKETQVGLTIRRTRTVKE